jgi:hypothetical protein
MEETMLLWRIAELMHLTRNELCDLAEQIAFKLPELEAGTVARYDALANLDNIRKVMRVRIFARERIAKARLRKPPSSCPFTARGCGRKKTRLGVAAGCRALGRRAAVVLEFEQVA